MAKLPKSLIKKYGISKKAWSVFRGQKTNKTKNKVVNVAKKKGGFRKSATEAGKGLGMVLAGMAYGASREWVSQKIEPLTSKLPGGYLADNVVLGATGYLLYKGKIPFLNKYAVTREVGKAMVYVESALAGVDIKQKAMTGGMTATAPNTSQNGGIVF